MSGSSSSGPSQRHSSISSLVFSTLAPGLSILPREEKSEDGGWAVIGAAAAEGTDKHTTEEGRGLRSDPEETSRSPASRSSNASVNDIHCEVEEGAKHSELENPASILSRLYSDSKQDKKQKKRLGFNSKSGAGSSSSSEHAVLSKQESSEDVFYPVVSKQLKQQMSKTSIQEETEKEAR